MAPIPVISPLEYAVYGVLCAAKLETGPEGARRVFRIEGALDYTADPQVITTALYTLVKRGWVRQLPTNDFGFIYYEAIRAPATPPVAHGCAICGQRTCKWAPPPPPQVTEGRPEAGGT